MTSKKSGKITLGKLIGAGLGLAAAVAVISLAVFPKVQKKLKKWMRDMQNEIIEEIKGTKDLTQERYNEIIDNVKSKYEALKSVTGGELNAFVEELKSHWEKIVKEVEKQAKKEK